MQLESVKTPKLNAPPGVVKLLRDLVHEHTGTFFDASRLDTLMEKLEPLAAARQCPSFLDYYFLLKSEAGAADEWQRVMEALSVQETYFWREMDQVRVLVDELVPAWFKQRHGPLRIWSAACATGEEPFTLAMALEEAGWFGRAPIEIVASDASVTALEKARRGIFRERSFRALPDELRARYFQSVPQGWCIDPKILVRVRFQRANLVQPAEIDALARAPIVFCRNVFIYFSPAAITRTVQHFYERMPPGSHLFVGVSESLRRLTDGFDLTEIGNAFAYVRKSAGSGGDLRS
jgi:chemotaxis protein methyltransferase CheR